MGTPGVLSERTLVRRVGEARSLWLSPRQAEASPARPGFNSAWARADAALLGSLALGGVTGRLRSGLGARSA